ncbi:Glycosyl transferase family 2 [Flavobacteriaceae bacterium MAR_2010_188]|nr:Glycosyl transferase family 2 [Flavobacteriaceae bacterium MAR_2010_188]
MAVNKPLVSVLMTAFNREKYLQSAVESLLKSTYYNWELIILDDCSTDSTFSLAQHLAAKDERIQVYRNSKNLGQFKNRNKIVDYAQGKYIKYLDSDDLIYPYGLEQLVYYMEQFPNAGYGFCSIKQDPNRIYPLLLAPSESYEEHFIKKNRIFDKAPLSSIIKKEVILRYGGFPHEAVSGDFAMWCLLAQTENVVLMPQGIVWYRTHEGQEMQKTRDSTIVEFEYFKVAEYFLSDVNCPLDNIANEIALKENRKTQKKYIFWKLRQQGLKVAWDLIKMKNDDFHLNGISHD